MNSPAKDKNALAAEAMPRVERIVRHMKRRVGHNVDEDEIRSFALNGLAMAIEKFDPSQNVPISTFAAKRIQGAVIDGINENKLLPRRLLRQVAFIKKSQEILRLEADSPPPNDKVETVHRLADRLKDLASVYITTCTATNEEHIESDAITDSEFIVDRKKYYSLIQNAIDSLPENQGQLVRQYFYEDATLENIATSLGKSRSWASRNLQTALATMRTQFEIT